MESSFWAQAAKLLRKQKKYKQWLAVFLCLAVAVTLGTLAALKLYGQAMTHTVKTLKCQLEIHEHTEACFDENGEIVCGCADYIIHTHNDDCYDTEGSLVCPLPEIEAHEHTDACYAVEEHLICETEDHEHEDSCYYQEETRICGYLQPEEHVHDASCFEILELSKEEVENLTGTGTSAGNKIYETEDYIVTASYSAAAHIPGEAELIAELITPEADPEHYGQRAAEFQETLDDTSYTMSALFLIGFYEDGEEIEPEAPVTITIQFLDEDGLEDGEPVTVVHFAEEGPEILDGSDAEDRSTTFQMESFSEIAIGRRETGTIVVLSDSFDYADDAFEIKFHIEGRAKTEEDSTAPEAEPEGGIETGTASQYVPSNENPDLNLGVQLLGEASREFTAIADYVEEMEAEKDNISTPFLIRGLSLSLKKGDSELELLNDCRITAEITPKEILLEQAEESLEQEEVPTEVFLTFMEIQDNNEINELEDVTVSKAGERPVAVAVSSNTIAMAASANPAIYFTAQYYANISVIDTEAGSGVVTLSMIDTRGRKLSENGSMPSTIKLYLEGNNSAAHVKYRDSLEKIFTPEEELNFYTYHHLDNFNKFESTSYVDTNGETITKESNYELNEIWVLREDGNPDSTDKKDWTVYPYDPDTDTPKLTNDLSDKNEREYILIQNNSVIRLVGKTKEPITYNNPAYFYDYDITDGKVYSDVALTTPVDRTYKGVLYGSSNMQGINHPGNYKTSGPKLAFGNANAGNIGTQNEKYNGYYINRYNNSTYQGGSYGMVSSTLGSDYLPVFHMAAPDLFSPENAIGKTVFTHYSLDFNQVGDTYILSSVRGSNSWAKNLETFQNVSGAWSNEFWPMNASATWGADGHDLKFGDAAKTNERKFPPTDKCKTDYYPVSDDKRDNNSYFGMSFSTDFHLPADYVGPLNYYFFGDDDMWVFLDNQLVCDIGGIHSAVGEYVDLWDYIPKDSSQRVKDDYTLRFFYTERGASGSTCWIQFTLPSASSQPIPDPPDGYKTTLTVNKTVTGHRSDSGEAFEFVIHFKDPSGTALYNTYPYTISGAGETKTGSIKDSNSFFLKNGESILVYGLPDGAAYTITEKEYSDYETEINGEISGDRTAQGTIHWLGDGNAQVNFNNIVVQYELPKTGGSGIFLLHIAAALLFMTAAVLLGYKYFKQILERGTYL